MVPGLSWSVLFSILSRQRVRADIPAPAATDDTVSPALTTYVAFARFSCRLLFLTGSLEVTILISSIILADGFSASRRDSGRVWEKFGMLLKLNSNEGSKASPPCRVSKWR